MKFFVISDALTKSIWERLRNNHRDALRRQRQSMKSGTSAASVTKMWKFQKQMEFLLSFMMNRQRDTNFDEQVVADDSQVLHNENEVPVFSQEDSEHVKIGEESEVLQIEDEAKAECYFATPTSATKKRDKCLDQRVYIKSREKGKRESLRQQEG